MFQTFWKSGYIERRVIVEGRNKKVFELFTASIVATGN